MTFLSKLLGHEDEKSRVEKFSHDFLREMPDEDLRSFFFSMDAEFAHVIRGGAQLLEEIDRREMKTPTGSALLRTLRSRKKEEGGGGSKDGGSTNGGDPTPSRKAVEVQPIGPVQSKIAFCSASPSLVDGLRGTPFCGKQGETLNTKYLTKLSLTRDDAFLMPLVPVLLTDPETGKAREPTDAEIGEWRPWFEKQLAEHAPAIVVALGQTARDALGKHADEWLPHPVAVRAYGERFEITRKLARVKRAIEEDLVLTEFKGEVIKADAEQQLVYGIVAEPEVVDAHGDLIRAEEIQNAAHRFLVKSRMTGEQHEKKAPAVVVESYVAPQDIELEGQEIAKGTWVIVMKVLDSEFWARVKKGEFTGFSLGGFARRVPAAA